MAAGPQKTKGVRWLYIAVALIVVLGLAVWLINYNSAPATDTPAAPAAPAATTTN